MPHPHLRQRKEHVAASTGKVVGEKRGKIQVINDTSSAYTSHAREAATEEGDEEILVRKEEGVRRAASRANTMEAARVALEELGNRRCGTDA